MPSLTLVLPFSLPPTAHARDLIAQLRMPALAKLLARASLSQRSESQAFDACLPHERWLCGHTEDQSPPIAPTLKQVLGISQPTAGHWFVLQPIHLHVARDHLVLTDYRQLGLSDTESRALFDATLPLFTDAGRELVYGNARYWFVRADAWADFRTCSPDAACGHNIDLWVPSGTAARDWRRLHNEVQMLWHQLALNEERETRGELRVNAVWLWGGSSADTHDPGTDRYAARLAQSGATTPGAMNGLHLIDDLLPYALADDWSGWMQQMHKIEQEHLGPALANLSTGQLERLDLVLSDAHTLSVWTVKPSSMRKFWVSASLSRLTS